MDGARDEAGIVLVAQVGEDVGELVRGQQEEEHEHVGLFRHLVPVAGVPFCFQDPVEPADVAVRVPVVLPVEFDEVLIARELADDPFVEGHAHAGAHVFEQR